MYLSTVVTARYARIDFKECPTFSFHIMVIPKSGRRKNFRRDFGFRHFAHFPERTSGELVGDVGESTRRFIELVEAELAGNRREFENLSIECQKPCCFGFDRHTDSIQGKYSMCLWVELNHHLARFKGALYR